MTSYKSSLGDIGTSLKSTVPSKSTLEKAAKDTKSATQTLVASLQGLGKPGTAAGDQAKQTLDGLASDLRNDASTIEGAGGADTGVVEAASVVSTTLVTAKNQVQTAVDDLRTIAVSRLLLESGADVNEAGEEVPYRAKDRDETVLDRRQNGERDVTDLLEGSVALAAVIARLDRSTPVTENPFSAR